MNATEPNAASRKATQDGGDDKDARASYRRRVKAAGIDFDNPPENIDEFRRQFARLLTMFTNQWHGCAERLCQRNRGCMAPSGSCSNAAPLPEGWEDNEWPQAKFKIHKMLEEEFERHGGLAALERACADE